MNMFLWTILATILNIYTWIPKYLLFCTNIMCILKVCIFLDLFIFDIDTIKLHMLLLKIYFNVFFTYDVLKIFSFWPFRFSFSRPCHVFRLCLDFTMPWNWHFEYKLTLKGDFDMSPKIRAVLQKPRNVGTYNSRQKSYLQTILPYL